MNLEAGPNHIGFATNTPTIRCVVWQHIVYPYISMVLNEYTAGRSSVVRCMCFYVLFSVFGYLTYGMLINAYEWANFFHRDQYVCTGVMALGNHCGVTHSVTRQPCDNTLTSLCDSLFQRRPFAENQITLSQGVNRIIFMLTIERSAHKTSDTIDWTAQVQSPAMQQWECSQHGQPIDPAAVFQWPSCGGGCVSGASMWLEGCSALGFWMKIFTVFRFWWFLLFEIETYLLNYCVDDFLEII